MRNKTVSLCNTMLKTKTYKHLPHTEQSRQQMSHRLNSNFPHWPTLGSSYLHLHHQLLERKNTNKGHHQYLQPGKNNYNPKSTKEPKIPTTDLRTRMSSHWTCPVVANTLFDSPTLNQAMPPSPDLPRFSPSLSPGSSWPSLSPAHSLFSPPSSMSP